MELSPLVEPRHLLFPVVQVVVILRQDFIKISRMPPSPLVDNRTH